MKDENPVYLKVEYSESVESKRHVLSSELSLLNIMKIIKRYESLRKDEFVLRAQMYKLIKEANALIRKTRNTFPYIKVPEKEKIALSVI